MTRTPSGLNDTTGPVYEPIFDEFVPEAVLCEKLGVTARGLPR